MTDAVDHGKRVPLPGEAVVHLWSWSLLASHAAEADYGRYLSPGEWARADRFRFPRDRRRYVVGRGTLRLRLAAYLGCPPGSVGIVQDEFGKPCLAGQSGRSPLVAFNLSHSGDLALLAVGGGPALGVDIEAIRPVERGVAGSVFAPDELAMLDAMPAHRREAAFFACWTRKEAYAKALGTGLSMALDSFAVSPDPLLPAAFLRIDGDPCEMAHWTLVDVAAGPGYAAALAVRAPGCMVEWRDPGPLAGYVPSSPPSSLRSAGGGPTLDPGTRQRWAVEL